MIIVLGPDIGEREAKRSSGTLRRSKFSHAPTPEGYTPSEELGADVARAKG